MSFCLSRKKGRNGVDYCFENEIYIKYIELANAHPDMASKDSKSTVDKVEVGADVPVNDNSSESAASQDRDETYHVYKQTQDLETTPEESKRVLRKIDTRLLPILILTYMLQYLDKNSINFASVYGLKEGTGLKGQDYSWLGVYMFMAFIVSRVY